MKCDLIVLFWHSLWKYQTYTIEYSASCFSNEPLHSIGESKGLELEISSTPVFEEFSTKSSWYWHDIQIQTHNTYRLSGDQSSQESRMFVFVFFLVFDFVFVRKVTCVLESPAVLWRRWIQKWVSTSVHQWISDKFAYWAVPDSLKV